MSQDEALIERFTRQENGSWLLTVFKGLNAVLDLQTVAFNLPFTEIYEDVKFGPEDVLVS